MRKVISLFLCLLPVLISLANAEARPNILFCIADDASFTSFGAYGDQHINTPAIDRLAKEGAVFTQAYNCNPKCAPARASLVTGMYSWQLKEAANHWPRFPEEFQFYPHLLMENGYHVGFTGKGWGPGEYPTKHNPAGPAFNQKKSKPPYKKMSNIDYAANFRDFLDQKNDDQPFCFWLGTKEPHRHYERDSYKKAGKKLSEADVPPFFPDNDTIRGDLLDYGLEVEWYDTHVGRAVELLRERNLLENTLIVVTSDHGMPFPRIKGQLYEESYHVPLIVYWENVVQPGRIIEDFINFPDVAPTFMEAVGLEPHEQMTGASFLDLIKSTKSGRIDPSRDHVLLGKERHDVGRAHDGKVDLGYPVRAIRNYEFLYVRNFKPHLWPACNPEYGLRNCDDSPTKSFIVDLEQKDPDNHFYALSFGKRPEEELYQIQKDPHCMNNLADNPQFSSIKNQLREQMEKELTAQKDPRMLGQGDLFDTYPYKGKPYSYD